ncbi:lipase family protein [Maridesulfovibrio zosterae]|uniref:lipase family protein n=1 Tax=Maridesulfovibrio zosterae TaxID=82171 RepID=UPI0003FF414E|nr:lipase family protein [Maridesulfovibrio zosterae]
MESYFTHQSLIKAPPIKRAAYSDRTAWMMAELSRLVYERLPNEQELENLLDIIFTCIKKNKPRNETLTHINDLAKQANSPQESITEKILDSVNYKLINSHAVLGTEVMVVDIPADISCNFPGMFVIVFRGTETDSIKDIKTDISAQLIPAPGGGKIHSGFLAAYQKVEDDLIQEIEKAGDKPIYITGHSLGGALAMIATKYLAGDSIGATYTFGAPRVADDAFYEGIKTPVYRVVNSADGVARLPFGAGFSIFLSGIRYIPINGTKRLSEFLRKHIEGYTHYGHLVMLTDISSTKSGTKSGLKVLHSPNVFGVVNRILPRMIMTLGKAAAADHKMAGYCEKLAQYAKTRI